MKNKAPSPSKRKIVISIVLVLLAIPALIAGGLYLKWRAELANTFGKVSFTNTLPIPELLEPTRSSGNRHSFDITMQQGQTTFFPGTKTATWGINGSYLGPTLRMKRGEHVTVHTRNALPETTSIHWHGMHLPAEMDGGPHQPIEPQATWSANWSVNQPAATLWYHPHPHGNTKKHVYRGLAGMIIIEDDNPILSQLPHTYGVDDIPVIVQDKKFTSDKQLSDSEIASIGLTGKDILVNGALTPHFSSTTDMVRLRLLNGSNARIYNFGLSNNEDVTLIATDGGLLEKPVNLNRLALSPGERAEVIVRLTPNERISLRSYPLKLSTSPLDQRSNGNDDSLEIMEIRAGESLTPSTPIPETLSVIEKLTPEPTSPVRDVELFGITINGKSMDMKRIDYTVMKDSTETWRVTNRADGPHNFHIHDVQFQIKSIGGSTPPAHLGGWKDTILLPAGSTAELVMRFSDYSDPRYPYMFHCHLLSHEDNGMMGQFVVLKPGDPTPYTLPTHSPGHSGH